MPIPTSRFLSEAECAGLAKRVASFRHGGGESRVQIESTWRGAMRFVRNTIQSTGDRRNNDIWVTRNIEGAECIVQGNQIDDTSVRAMVLRAEHMTQFEFETGDTRFQQHATTQLPFNTDVTALAEARSSKGFAVTALPPEPIEHPKLFFDSTFNMSSPRRASAVGSLVADASKMGMLAAGYIEVSATGTAMIDTYGNQLYYPMTEAQYTVTVRDPEGTGSGWAGVNWNDWNRIDGVKLSQIALDKCLRSRNPVRVEPGRYTTILEPQAVHDLFWPWILLENWEVGKKAIDERLTVAADPMDPDLGFLPVDRFGNAYHAATWIERGIGKTRSYSRLSAIRNMHKNTGLPNSMAYRMDAAPGVATASADEMIATTERGIFVTHFWLPSRAASILLTGYTRDGTWLIEKGKLTRAVKNFQFFANTGATFNNVEQVGPSHRVYSRSWDICPAAIAPALKVRDFNFTALTDAV